MVAHRLIEDGEGAESEDIELDEAEQLDIVFVELADANAAGGVFQRYDVDERFCGDEHAAVVQGEMARVAVELLAEIDDLPRGVESGTTSSARPGGMAGTGVSMLEMGPSGRAGRAKQCYAAPSIASAELQVGPALREFRPLLVPEVTSR